MFVRKVFPDRGAGYCGGDRISAGMRPAYRAGDCRSPDTVFLNLQIVAKERADGLQW